MNVIEDPIYIGAPQGHFNQQEKCCTSLVMTSAGCYFLILGHSDPWMPDTYCNFVPTEEGKVYEQIRRAVFDGEGLDEVAACCEPWMRPDEVYSTARRITEELS